MIHGMQKLTASLWSRYYTESTNFSFFNIFRLVLIVFNMDIHATDSLLITKLSINEVLVGCWILDIYLPNVSTFKRFSFKNKEWSNRLNKFNNKIGFHGKNLIECHPRKFENENSQSLFWYEEFIISKHNYDLGGLPSVSEPMKLLRPVAMWIC